MLSELRGNKSRHFPLQQSRFLHYLLIGSHIWSEWICLLSINSSPLWFTPVPTYDNILNWLRKSIWCIFCHTTTACYYIVSSHCYEILMNSVAVAHLFFMPVVTSKLYPSCCLGSERVYQVPVFTREFCQQFLEEIKHFEEDSSLPKGRPNTMNKYGVSKS